MHLLQDAALEKSGNGREAKSGHSLEITKKQIMRLVVRHDEKCQEIR